MPILGGTQLGQEIGRNFESAPEPGKKLTNYSAAKKLGQKITQAKKWVRKKNT